VRVTQHADIGVIFDMDGVLVDSAKPHLRSWELLSEETGVAISAKQIADTFGRHNSDIIPRLFGDVTDDRLRTLASRKEELYRDLVRDNPPLVEGATDLIEQLNTADSKLAIGSSGPLDNIQLILSALGVDKTIATIVSGDDVTRGKPDPQVFAIACERLSLSPSRCVVIEDAPVGIEAAMAAGTKSIGVCLYQTRDALGAADLIVEKLSDLTVDMIGRLIE
jgi:HAD superfamily hydrolase (TIGR01509 family)